MAAPASGLAMAGLAHAGEVAVMHDGADVAAALIELFNLRGYGAYGIEEASELRDSTKIVISLAGLREWTGGEEDDICRGVFRLARAFARRTDAGDCVFVSVQNCGGDFGLSGSSRAIVGSLAGLVKTAAQEWPSAALKAIDIERAGRDAGVLAEAIFNEVFQGGPEIEVGLHASGLRTTLRSTFEPIERGDFDSAAATPAPASAVLPDNAVVICSGGARGVTAATMLALARAQPLRFALLGRTALSEEPAACRGIEGDAGLKRALLEQARAQGAKITPAELGRSVQRILAQREIEATLAAIRQTGGDAVYLAVDVTDVAALSQALAGVRSRWGSIDAVVHGAGVVADKLIAEKTDEQFERVWSTKVAGLRALLRATAADRLRALILFASVAARSGNVGQCDYAMANEALNKLAALETCRRGRDCIVKSLNWGPWEAGMVTPSLKAYFEEHGVELISLKRGGEMLLQELAIPSIDADTGKPRIEIVLGTPPQQAAIAGGQRAERVVDVLVAQHTYPYLADHAVDGTVVLPLVVALEWFCRAAEVFSPGMRVVACEQLRVLRGVPQSHFADGGDWLQISVQPHAVSGAPSDVAAAELSLAITLSSRAVAGAGGPVQRPHYAAIMRLRPDVAEPAPAASVQLGARQLRQGPSYGGALFHGPAFQVLQGDVMIGADGADAAVAGLRTMNWPQEPWCNDPALLDGGLQLAVLWSEQRLGGHALPASVASYRRHVVGAALGPVHCRQRGEADGAVKGVSHIEFLDGDGRLIAEMVGVETYTRP